MRLWHFKLIRWLPQPQLIAQWRECISAAKSIKEKGTPNHILINKINDYSILHFRTYCKLIETELRRRKINVSDEAINKLVSYIDYKNYKRRRMRMATEKTLFKRWHDKEYLTICYYNLYEKYLCGGVKKREWSRFKKGYEQELKKYENPDTSDSKFDLSIESSTEDFDENTSED